MAAPERPEAKFQWKDNSLPATRSVHGTVNGYCWHGCRCDACREAAVNWQRNDRAKNPEKWRERDRRRHEREKERKQEGRLGDGQVPSISTERWCACGTKLSRYNPGDRCALCDRPEGIGPHTAE